MREWARKTKYAVWWTLVVGAMAVGIGLWNFAGSAPRDLDERSAAADASASFSLIVDVSDRTLYVKKDGEVVESYPVTVGKPGHATPRGSFRIRHIVWNPRWVPPEAKWAEDKKPRAPGDPKNPMGRVKMFFMEPDYYVHGTMDTESLGQAASHGCVRMRNSDVIEVARMVMNNGGEPREASWFRRVIDRVRSTRQVWLSRPVPITVRS